MSEPVAREARVCDGLATRDLDSENSYSVCVSFSSAATDAGAEAFFRYTAVGKQLVIPCGNGVSVTLPPMDG